MTRVLVLAVLLVGVFNVAAAAAEKSSWLGVAVLVVAVGAAFLPGKWKV